MHARDMVKERGRSRGRIDREGGLPSIADEREAASDEEVSVRTYMDVIAELPVGISVIRIDDLDDAHGWQILEMNPAALRLTGAKDAEARRSVADFAPGIEDTPLAKAVREVVATGRDQTIFDYVSRRRAGAVFWMKVFSLGGRLIGLAFEDVTAVRAAQDALRQKSAALARSNADLAQFAFMASHDLQAPLRKASAFAGFVRQGLDPSRADDLDRLERCLAEMQQLVEGLLALARVAGSGAAAAPVDLDVLVADVVKDLEPALAPDGGRVEVGPLPPVSGDARLLRQLMRNLLSNAVKFRRPGTPVRVRVHGRVLPDGARELVVEDEGVGFDMKRAERLFQPFGRLHGHGEFPGTGMGLALCRKVVERHGGTIEAESEVGRGTRIRVVLPAGAPRPAKAVAGGASWTSA